MQLALVLGTATSTVKHPSLEGWKLLVAQPLAAELFFQNAVLLNKILDDLGLLAVDPGREDAKEELEGHAIGGH